MPARRPLLSLHVAVTMRIELPAPLPSPASDLAVREVAPDDLDVLLGGADLLVARAAHVGRRPWRAFVVTADGRPIHHTFVTLEPAVPRLFKLYTHPDHRRRGAFLAAMPEVARALAGDGHPALESSCNAANAPSIAAHRRAGFREIRRAYHPYVLGFDLRAAAGRLRR